MLAAGLRSRHPGAGGGPYGLDVGCSNDILATCDVLAFPGSALSDRRGCCTHLLDST
jgi:hypothetical protein